MAIGGPGALLLVQEGDRADIVALGLADRRTGRRLVKNDVWRIASVTKLVTAVVIIQLVRESRLGLDDPLSKYLPGSIRHADRITIRQLLNHTSGIPDYLADPRTPLQISARRLVADLRTKREFGVLLRAANRQKRQFAPGEMHEYSNTNYLLLGQVIEEVTGRRYSTVVRERVLVPLGLTRAGFPSLSGRLPSNAIRTYVAGDGPRGPFTSRSRLRDVTRHTNFLGADGGLYANGHELARLLDAIWRGSLLTPSEREIMTSNLVEDHDGTYRYGLGTMAFPTRCRRIVVGHEARDLGSYTLALTDRSNYRHLVLMTNKSIDGLPNTEKTIDAIRNAVFCADRREQRGRLRTPGNTRNTKSAMLIGSAPMHQPYSDQNQAVDAGSQAIQRATENTGYLGGSGADTIGTLIVTGSRPRG